MLKWQFSPLRHWFKLPPLLFNPGQRSIFSEYVSVKCCQHLPESVAENKERSRADGKRRSLSKDALFARCRNQRERGTSQLPGGISIPLSIPLYRIKGDHSDRAHYNWAASGFCSLHFLTVVLFPSLSRAAHLSIPTWVLPQSPLRAVPCTALSSNLTIIYPQNLLLLLHFLGKVLSHLKNNFV